MISWLLVTLWLGLTACWQGARFVLRAPRIFTTSLRCPRGHRVNVYGAFTCRRCRGSFEGHAFDPCPLCGARARFISCPRCGLAVKDPAR
jgi:hypothetical protein